MVVVANQTNRGPGLVDTGTLTLATVLGGPVQPNMLYVGRAILSPADRDDPTLVLGQVTLYLDGIPVWGPSDMPGGATDRNGTPVMPEFGWGSTALPLPTTCRITFDPSRRVSVGLDLSTRPMTR